MEELTAFQRDLIRIVSGMEKPHGLALKEELEDYYGEQVNHGRLYPNLDELVDEGYINKSEKDGRTNTYTLTPQGRSAIKARTLFNQENAPDETTKNLVSDA